jgi:hypothetical protein
MISLLLMLVPPFILWLPLLYGKEDEDGAVDDADEDGGGGGIILVPVLIRMMFDGPLL